MATEIVRAKIKDSADPERLNRAMAYFQTGVKGLQSSGWGLAVDEPNTLVVVINWDSVEAHGEWMKTAVYSGFREEIGPIFDGPSALSICHTYLQPFPSTKIFQTANVELVYLTKKDGVSAEKFDEAKGALLDTITGTAGYNSHHHGIQHEDNNIYMIVIGWDSHEAQSLSYSARKELISGVAESIFLNVNLSPK